MDYNGNDVSGGTGSLPDPLDIPAICAEDGTFQNLDVGPCGGPALYQLPRVAKGAQPRAVIVDESAQTINISEIQRVMQAFYVAIDSFTIPSAGEYTIDELVQLVQDGFNTKYAAETNVLTMWVGNDGHVRARITEGSQPSFRMVETLGLLQMGNTADSGAIPPNTTYRFPSLPNFSGTVQQSGWRGYNFDESGYIFEGDMRITGALEVSTIVADLEVEDSLIFINKNAPIDGFSTGLVVNSFNNTRFGGLVKADSSPSWFLFSNSATIPTASGWTPEQTGSLFLTDLNAAGQVTIGAPASSYSLPIARGNDGDILITDAVGGVSWQVPTTIRSPDGLNQIVASNGTILTTYSGANRIYVDVSNTDILSGDNSYVVSVNNSRMLVSDTTPGGRFELNNAETFLKSPDKNTLITILDNDMYADIGGTQSFRATPTVTTLKGGGGNNPTITLQSGTSSWVHSTRECLTTAPTAVEIGYDAGTATYNKFEASGFTKHHAGTIRETVDGSNTFLYSPDGVSSSTRLGNTIFITRVAGINRFRIDTAESIVKAPNDINSVGVSNIQTRVNGQFAVNGLTRFESSGVELLNGVPLRLGHTSASVEKPVSVLMVSNANIIKGIVLKIVNVGGSARVEPVGTADPDGTSVIGVSLAAAVIGGDVEVAVGGLFECSIQSGVTVTVGDSVEKSDAETGRIIPVAPNPGTFGVALTTATGSVDGSVRALVMFKKNEVL